MNKKLLLGLAFLIIFLVPIVHAQDATPVKIDDAAPFWAKWFQGFFFSGSTADYQCRSTWECIKFTSGSYAGQYRYNCYADASSSTGCLCYGTTDPSKCQTNQPSTTTTTSTSTSTTSGGSMTSGCSDSDNSNGQAMSQGTPDQSIFTKGTVTIGLNKFTDSCYGNIIYERACQSDASLGTWGFNCPNGCSDGACTGASTGCKYSNPSCGSGYVCDTDRNTCLKITTECTQGTEQCSGTKEQFCDQNAIGSTYWRDIADCAPNSCSVLSNGKAFCGTSTQAQQVQTQINTPSTGATSPTRCTADSDCVLNGANSKCVSGTCSGGTSGSTSSGGSNTALLSPSLTYEDWKDAYYGVRLQSMCNLTSDCAPYEDPTGKSNYSVACKGTSAINAQLHSDAVQFCKDNPSARGSVVGLLKGGLTGCSVGALVGAGVGVAAAGVGAVPGAIGGCIIGGASTAILGSGFTFVGTVNCGDSDANTRLNEVRGACIAQLNAPLNFVDQLLAPYSISGISLPVIVWVIIFMLGALLIVKLASGK